MRLIEGYLEEVLKRMTAKPKECVFPQGCLERKQVDEKAPDLGHTTLSTDAADRSTLPLNVQGRTIVSAALTVGFVFWLEPGATKAIQVRYLSQAKDALTIINENWCGPEFTGQTGHPGRRIHYVAAHEGQRDVIRPLDPAASRARIFDTSGLDQPNPITQNKSPNGPPLIVVRY